MNTLHFKYAVEVERTRSITQAAENLFMAQPNLSKAIKELEDTLGIEIFERSPKGVVPTKKGAEFLSYAMIVLEQLDKMEKLHITENAERQSFKISMPRSSYIAQAFTSFVSSLDVNNEIDVSVQETNSMQTISNILEDGYNLGIIRYQTDYENYFLDYLEEKKLSFEPVWEFEYLVLMSRSHPLAGENKLDYSDLSHYIEIAHNDIAVPYLPAARVKKETAEKRIYVYERCSQFDMLSNIPSTYMWVAPVPERFLSLYDLIQRKCYGANHKYKDLLVYPSGYHFTKLDRQFIDELSAAKNEVAFRQYD